MSNGLQCCEGMLRQGEAIARHLGLPWDLPKRLTPITVLLCSHAPAHASATGTCHDHLPQFSEAFFYERNAWMALVRGARTSDSTLLSANHTQSSPLQYFKQCTVKVLLALGRLGILSRCT